MAKKLPTLTVNELKIFIQPLEVGVKDLALLEELISLTGWSPNAMFGTDLTSLAASIKGSVDSIKSLVKSVKEGPPTKLDEIKAMLNDIKKLVKGLKAMAGVQILRHPGKIPQFIQDLVSTLLVIYLQRRAPILFESLRLLTIIDENPVPTVTVPVQGKPDLVLKSQPSLPHFEFTRLAALISHPGDFLKAAYWPNGIPDFGTAKEVADKLFPRIGSLLKAMGVKSVIGLPPNPDFLNEVEQNQLKSSMVFRKSIFVPAVNNWIDLGATVGLLPSPTNPGVYIVPLAPPSIKVEKGAWQLDLVPTGDVPGLAITKNGFSIYSQAIDYALQAILTPTTTETPAFLIGDPNGTHLEIGKFKVTSSLGLKDQAAKYGLRLEVSETSLNIAAGDGDGFISKVMPKEGITVPINFIVGWNNTQGIYFEGGSGLDLDIPLNMSVANILNLKRARLKIDVNEKGITAASSLSGSLKIGPFKATVEDMGMEMALLWPKGDEGFVFDIGFKPPSGIALALDTALIKGAGYLSIDSKAGRYAGIAELTIKDKVSVKAIAIIDTKVDGGKGFAMLLVITSSFPPLQLGLGFTLNGVGGLIGVNRSMNLDLMATKVRDGSLQNMFFLSDPMADFPKVISDMDAVFPLHHERYVFGPMGKLGWGSPTLLTMDVALLIEVPDPVRLAIVGSLQMVLPTGEKAAATLKVAFLGKIDFDAKSLSFDAWLFDSRIASFTLEGGMALRLNWGKKPSFLLSIGGFNPAFKPPANLGVLPELSRLSLNLVAGDDPRITLSAYFALTSNTVQVGARVEFYMKVVKIAKKTYTVEGFLGFDVLFQFSPFYFRVNFEAGLTVKKGEKSILSIYLAGSLEGPKPWKVAGKAEFKIFKIPVTISFTKTFGEKEVVILPDISVLPKLIEALASNVNWSALLPEQKGNSVSLKSVELPKEIVLADPVSALGVSQNVVPLGIEISKFGQYKVSDVKKSWTLKLYDANGLPIESESTVADFAPAQYFEKSDVEKVASPSFDEMKSGIVGKKGRVLSGNAFICRDIKYEETIYDGPAKKVTAARPSLTPIKQATLLRGNAIAQSPMGGKKQREMGYARIEVSLGKNEYVVASKNDGSKLPATQAGSAIEAGIAMAATISGTPMVLEHLQVMPA